MSCGGLSPSFSSRTSARSCLPPQLVRAARSRGRSACSRSTGTRSSPANVKCAGAQQLGVERHLLAQPLEVAREDDVRRLGVAVTRGPLRQRGAQRPHSSTSERASPRRNSERVPSSASMYRSSSFPASCASSGWCASCELARSDVVTRVMLASVARWSAVSGSRATAIDVTNASAQNEG